MKHIALLLTMIPTTTFADEITPWSGIHEVCSIDQTNDIQVLATYDKLIVISKSETVSDVYDPTIQGFGHAMDELMYRYYDLGQVSDECIDNAFVVLN